MKSKPTGENFSLVGDGLSPWTTLRRATMKYIIQYALPNEHRVRVDYATNEFDAVK